MSKVIYNKIGTKFEFFQTDKKYAPRNRDRFSVDGFDFSWMEINGKLLHSGLTYKWVEKNIQRQNKIWKR